MGKDEHSEQDTENASREKQAKLRAGEKAFTVVLFLAGVFLFYHSLKLWLRLNPPRSSSAAALPLITSGLWVVLTLTLIIENLLKKTPLSGIKSLGQKISKGLLYVFPKEVLVTLCAMAIYCVLLLIGVSFYIVTPLFLYGAMCYLTGKGYIRNILWTAIIMGFTIVVFKMLFGVAFP